MTDFTRSIDDAIAEARSNSLPLQLQSEHIDKISAALAKAQAAMTNALYNRENPHFKSQYADLASVRHATMECLSANGISLTQQATFHNGDYIQVTQLSLGDQFLRDFRPLLVALDKPQVMIAFGTYMRRAGWTSICGIAVAGEDDDGNRASGVKLITQSQLESLIDIAKDGDMGVFLPWLSEQLGYPVENLSMVKRADMQSVKSKLLAATAKKARKK